MTKPDPARTVLPIPERVHVGLTTYDAKDPDTVYPPIEPLRPPAGAPNVMVILLDDAGFGSSSAFGGPCQTPAFERLAGQGLRFTRFHTTALCSPTRQALLTGRNHHAVGMGGITEIATSAPGYDSILPNTASPLAEILKLNGYSTAQFGKCHEVPVWQTSPMGPFNQWPTGGGFEHFYGFIGGETNQFYPALYDGVTPVEPPKTPEEGYHLTEDLADRTISWVSQQKSLMPDKPFFVYFAPGATHAPHQAPKEWIDKYAGKFDQGWDVLREESFARQKALGVVPEDAELTARPDAIGAWDDVPEELKPVLARQMEVYAGFMEHTDHQVGRVIEQLEKLEVLDDTLIFLMVGDNGASAEGTPNGTFNEIVSLNGAAALETVEFMSSHIDEFGTPAAYNHYAVGWAHAMDTPFQWTKQIASHFGGTCTGPTGSRRVARCATSSTTSSTSPRPSSRLPVSPSRRSSTGSSRCRCTGWTWPTRSTTRMRPRRARRSTSSSRATARSITRAGPQSPGTASPGTSERRCRLSTTTSGSCTTRTPTGRRHATSPVSTPRSSSSSSGCG
jgi:arylsulfatase